MARCGILLPNGVRHFCRAAACQACVRYAARRRAWLFALRCAPMAAQGPWLAFVLPLDGMPFFKWRTRIHDRVEHRRGRDSNWKKFGLIGRLNGRDQVIGVVSLATLGFLDLWNLMDGVHVRDLPRNNAETVAQTLAAGPIAQIPGSLKSIFVTINPRTVAWNVPRAPEPRYYEPMPFVCFESII